MSDRRVQGRCPMGCGDTLFLGNGGYVTCSWEKCPNPSAVSDLLLDHATPHHIVDLGSTSFSIQHPMRERLNGELFDCQLHAFLDSLTGPPRAKGRYEVIEAGNVEQWSWRHVADTSSGSSS